MPYLRVNGVDRKYQEETFPKTIDALIQDLTMDRKAVVAEVNGEIVSREQFDTFELRPGLTVELIQFVGGG